MPKSSRKEPASQEEVAPGQHPLGTCDSIALLPFPPSTRGERCSTYVHTLLCTGYWMYFSGTKAKVRSVEPLPESRWNVGRRHKCVSSLFCRENAKCRPAICSICTPTDRFGFRMTSHDVAWRGGRQIGVQIQKKCVPYLSSSVSFGARWVRV